MSENETYGEGEYAEVWECGPHANAWHGHDARCRRIIPPAEPTNLTTQHAEQQEESK